MASKACDGDAGIVRFDETGTAMLNGAVRKEKYISENGTCGWQCGSKFLSCTTLQPLATAKWTLLLFSFTGLCHHGVMDGLIAVIISTLEKRFELRSTESGLIASMSDLGRGVLTLFMIFSSSRVDKPRWIGWGLITAGLATFAFSLPHYTAPRYNPVVEDIVNYCGNVTDPDCSVSSVKNYLYWFIACFCLIGAGTCPATVYSVTYLDENLKKKNSALYNAIYYSIGGLGPAFGFVFGGMALEIYTYPFTDPSELNIDSSSYSWVGAWWIGFILAGVLIIIAAIPTLMLPKYLPGTEKYRNDRDKEAQRSHYKSAEENRNSAGAVFGELLSLFKNKPYMFVTFGSTMNYGLVYGFNTFGAKYLESVFGLSPFHSALLYGIAAIFASFGAQIASGLIVKKFDLQVVGILKFMIITGIISAFCSIGFLVHCEDIDFAGGTVPYTNSSGTMSLLSSCNDNCSCTTDRYDPVCANGITYFSPCFAGCQVQINETSFTNCSCVMSTTSHVDHDAVASSVSCDWKSCDAIVPFMFIVFICFFTSILTLPPSLQVTLRCVPFDKRDMAMSLQYAVCHIIGIIPARALVGYVLDKACVAWSTECGGQGSCKVYDRGNIARNNAILLLAQTIVVAILYGLVLFTYKPVGESGLDETKREDFNEVNVETPLSRSSDLEPMVAHKTTENA